MSLTFKLTPRQAQAFRRIVRQASKTPDGTAVNISSLNLNTGGVMGYREGRYIDEDTLEKIRKGEQLTPENRKDGWSSQSGSRFTRAAVIQAKLDAGAYTFFKNDHGFFFDKKTMVADRVSELPGLPIDYVLNQIKTFWERKDLYKQHGLLHKRGIMLYGGPGCGKTSIINLLCKQIMARDGVIFIIDDFEDA